MRLPDDTFATSLDATDPNGEGAYYTWTPDEVRAVLPHPDAFLAAYGVGDHGTVRGRSVLVRRDPMPSLDADRAALLAARAKRPAPRRDEQRIVAWNALCVSALARAGRLLDRPDAVAAAAGTAEVLLATRRPDGTLPRTLEPGSPPGVLDDHAFLAEALVDLYEATGDPRWLVAADGLLAALIATFGDPGGGLWTTAPVEPIGVRVQEWSDGAAPSGAGRALVAWARLYRYGAPAADPQGLDRALRAAHDLLRRAPGAAPSLLLVVDGLSRAGVQAVVVGDEAKAVAFAEAFDATWRPHAVLAVVGPTDDVAPFATLVGKAALPGEAVGYVCFDGVCRQPTTDPDAFRAALDRPPLEEGASGAIP